MSRINVKIPFEAQVFFFIPIFMFGGLEKVVGHGHTHTIYEISLKLVRWAKYFIWIKNAEKKNSRPNDCIWNHHQCFWISKYIKSIFVEHSNVHRHLNVPIHTHAHIDMRRNRNNAISEWEKDGNSRQKESIGQSEREMQHSAAAAAAAAATTGAKAILHWYFYKIEFLSRNHLTCAVQPDYGSSLSLQQLPLSPRIEQIAPLFDPGREF